jgi:hypothetical protein
MLFLPLTSPATDYYGGDRKGANLFGDALRDALDPRLRNRSRGARGARGRFRRTLKEIS